MDSDLLSVITDQKDRRQDSAKQEIDMDALDQLTKGDVTPKATEYQKAAPEIDRTTLNELAKTENSETDETVDSDTKDIDTERLDELTSRGTK